MAIGENMPHIYGNGFMCGDMTMESCETVVRGFVRFRETTAPLSHFKLMPYLQALVCVTGMGSNVNVFAFKCILNTFEKYLHLHFSNEKYFSNTLDFLKYFLFS